MNKATKRRNKRRKDKDARDDRVQNKPNIKVEAIKMPARMKRGFKSRLI